MFKILKTVIATEAKVEAKVSNAAKTVGTGLYWAGVNIKDSVKGTINEAKAIRQEAKKNA